MYIAAFSSSVSFAASCSRESKITCSTYAVCIRLASRFAARNAAKTISSQSSASTVTEGNAKTNRRRLIYLVCHKCVDLCDIACTLVFIGVYCNMFVELVLNFKHCCASIGLRTYGKRGNLLQLGSSSC